MKRASFVVFLLLCLGCASKQVVLLNGASVTEQPLCLDDRAGIPAIVQKFYATRDLTTEEGKIDYLIERVRSSNLVFVRNRVEYSGPQAAGFLRWKLGRMERSHHIKVKTAQDFVSEVASGSRMSHQPYTVALRDGGREDLQYVLQNELDVLEACLKQYAAKVEEVNSGASTQASTRPTTAQAGASPVSHTLSVDKLGKS
ncbi:MAG: DUF5329 family protein [Candidatus Omnitrophica bacterium]|nr:DUF5329 family protein [Candidatus Omnitrophota bacterium]